MIRNKKGAATTELILLLPLMLVFFWAFMKLFKISTESRFRLINAEHKQIETLQKKELSVSVLERPCQIDPAICDGRKK
ncbi:MAG: hypothetical protein HY877_06815 [Deltaproteobacteria bacterium]|nr:hypothetical protein [Deltaproteobacteria bacterium]